MKNVKIYLLIVMCLSLFCLSACDENVMNYIDDIIGEATSDTEAEADIGEESNETSVESESEIIGEAQLDDAVPYTESQQFSEEAEKSLEELREEMAAVPSVPSIFGTAYIAYFDNSDISGLPQSDLDTWLPDAIRIFNDSAEASEYLRFATDKQYPFLAEIDKAHIVGEEGWVYCIVAQDPNSSVSVSSVETGEVLYRSKNGDPILVLFDGDPYESIVLVTIKTAEGNEYNWSPTLSELSLPNSGYPNVLMGENHEILSWDFGHSFDDVGFDFKEWLDQDWLGLTTNGLASVENGTSWSYKNEDNNTDYILSFNITENDFLYDYKGEVILQCFYDGSDEVQAEWRGWWRVETALELPSLLYASDMSLVSGADMAAYEDISNVWGKFWLLAPQSGNNILLVDEDCISGETDHSVLPIFPEGECSVMLDPVQGYAVENMPENDAVLPYTESQQFSADAGTSIDALREEMVTLPSEPAVFSMGYIGYYEYNEETGIDFGQWFEHAAAPLAAQYPFISEIDAAHTVGESGHLYCIMAHDYASAISVQDMENGDVLYQSENGDPILVFCSHNGDAHIADTVVAITTTDGHIYAWEAKLDEWVFPNILVGESRRLLSWDMSNTLYDTGFDYDAWYEMGWGGLTAVGLAQDENGNSWGYTEWDSNVSYTFNFRIAEHEGYDGDVTVECYYADSDKVQAEWYGFWRMETEPEKASTLYVDMSLINGEDMAAFESRAKISESYKLLAPMSGEQMMLVADEQGSALLPIFTEGYQSAELYWIDPYAVG